MCGVLVQVKGPRDKRLCDMCCNYEAQLQTIQESEKKCQDKLRVLERQMQVYECGIKVIHCRYVCAVIGVNRSVLVHACDDVVGEQLICLVRQVNL